MMKRNIRSSATNIVSWHVPLRGLVPMILMGLLVLSLSSCVAQQADLVRFQQEFEAKIAKLDQEKQNLQSTLAEANRVIQESKNELAKQKSEVSGLVRDRAKFNSELRSIKEENLTQLSGNLESESHRLQRLERVVDDLMQGVKSLEGDLVSRDEARAKETVTLRDNVQKEFDLQSKTMSEQMAGFRASLVEFKDALAEVDTRLVAETKRATTAETNMKNDVGAQQAALQVKLDSDTKTLKQYLEQDVHTSISSVAKTLQEVNATLGTQLDGQGADLKAQSAVLSQLNTKVGTELAALKKQDEVTHQNLENLTKTMTQLRSGLDSAGSQLGAKIDEHAQSLQKSSGQLTHLESQYAALSKKLESDTQALRGYLDKDIRASLQSMANAVEAEKTRGGESSKKLESMIQQLEKTSKADVTQMKTQLAGQDQHVKDLNQSVVTMRGVLDSMAGMLGKRSDDQMQEIGKLAAQLDQVKQEQSSGISQKDINMQTLSAHLNEVTTSVQSVVSTLDQVKTSLSSRLDQQAARLAEQEQRLTQTTGSSVSSQKLNEELQGNVQHLNQLSTAMGQLKTVVNNIGTTLGKKVDEHEGKLAGLAQQVQQLQSSRGSKAK
ncbi:MAG: hypothetical protein O2999_02880 [Nitrospirae bacterium]|nr:hypothetical protein [Nitrospirota bacterium]MDA1303236.1 hypothetical protein [Nitrospirota bacterium]